MMKIDDSYMKWGAIVLIISLGLFIRFQLNSKTIVDNPIRADATQYYFYALNMKTFGVYSDNMAPFFSSTPPKPDCRRPPGYSVFLMPFVKFPPDMGMLDNILLAQVFLGGVTILMTFLFMSSFVGVVPSLGAALLVALSPHLVASGVYMLTETLAACSLVVFAWSVARFHKNQSLGWALAVGLLLGVCTLIRFTTLYFVVLLLPFVFLSIPSKKVTLVLVVFLGFMAAYGPWIVRNKIVLPQSHGSSLARDTIHKGMYPWLMYKGDPRTFGIPNRFDPEWGKRQTTAEVLTEVKLRVKEKPAEYLLWYVVGKPYYFLSWNIIVGIGDVFVYPLLKNGYEDDLFLKAGHELMYILHWLIVIASLISMIVVWIPYFARGVSDSLLFAGRFLSLLYGYFILVHVVGTPLPRYSVPLRPVIYSLALILPVVLKTWAEMVRGKEIQVAS